MQRYLKKVAKPYKVALLFARASALVAACLAICCELYIMFMYFIFNAICAV